MRRSVTLTASLLIACAIPAFAQTHDRFKPHGPGHVRPDSATHAAMHALVHGTWTGTLSGHHGLTSSVEMSIAHDSLRNVMLEMHADHAVTAAAARDIVMKGNTLEWTQAISGKTCRASAILTAAKERAPDTMKGKMICDSGEMTFTLRKKAE